MNYGGITVTVHKIRPLPPHRILSHQQPFGDMPFPGDLADHGEGEGAFALEDFGGAGGAVGSEAGGSRVKPGMTRVVAVGHYP